MKSYGILILMLISSLAQAVVTNPPRFDGFGGQFQTIIYSVIYAEMNNQEYLYTPFTKMEHNYDDDPDFINKKERIINFIDHFEINKDPSIQSLGAPHFVRYFEEHLEQCANSESLKKIKAFFRESKNKRDYFDDENFNIAIHIRRPNSHDSRIAGTQEPDELYLKIIESLRSKYRSRKPLFHVYSQGDLEVFKKTFGADDIVLHINGSVEDSFIPMVLADALVSGTSSYSYVAAILSEGDIYYIPFWHPPFPHWTQVNGIL